MSWIIPRSHADVGIAIGAGTDVAVESAGVVLARNDPRAVIGEIRLSKMSYRKMRQNLVIACPHALGLAIGVKTGRPNSPIRGQ